MVFAADMPGVGVPALAVAVPVEVMLNVQDGTDMVMSNSTGTE